MPRIKRRNRRTSTDYTATEMEALCDGCDCLGEFHARVRDRHGRRDREAERDAALVAMSAAWEDLRDYLLPTFIAEHPGTRPWAWWAFDAPEPREQVLSCEETGWRPITDRVSRGVPAEFAPIPSSEHPYGMFPPVPEPMYESEFDYLMRLNLATDEELTLIA